MGDAIAAIITVFAMLPAMIVSSLIVYFALERFFPLCRRTACATSEDENCKSAYENALL